MKKSALFVFAALVAVPAALSAEEVENLELNKFSTFKTLKSGKEYQSKEDIASATHHTGQPKSHSVKEDEKLREQVAVKKTFKRSGPPAKGLELDHISLNPPLEEEEERNREEMIVKKDRDVRIGRMAGGR